METRDADSTILRYKGSYELAAGQQEVSSGTDARLDLDAETLTVLGDYGDIWVVPLRQIVRLGRADYRVNLELQSGEMLSLFHLGFHYDGFWRDLTRLRNELIITDSLMRETIDFPGVEAHFWIDRDGLVEEGECEARLYETALALMTEEDGVMRIPYGLIAGVAEDDYTLVVKTEQGDTVRLSAMGRNTDPFRLRLSGALNRITERTADFLRELCPDLSPVTVRQLANLLRDGRLAYRGDLEAISPGLWTRLEERLGEFGCRAELEYLASLSSSEDLFIGMKRGLMGDLTGEYMWFLVPILAAPGEPGNAMAMEVAAREGGGRATYFFRIANREEYPDLDPDELASRARDVAAEINHCMLLTNFRREPIYLPEDRLAEPRYARYVYAVHSLRPLQVLRHLFVGRVIHRSYDQWTRDVGELLTFNVTTEDPSARWQRGPAK